MKELLRRLWHELSYDPLVEYRRAKGLLVKRLAWSEAEERKRRRSKLSLWRSDQRPDDQ